MRIQQETAVGGDQERECSDEDDGVKPRLGVCFSQLNCYGSLTSDQYQATVASSILAVPMLCLNLLRSRPVHKIHILRDFEGLIRPGEMLLVLGRPGSGCSTFLKALAGEANGLEIGTESNICYQGIPFKEMHESLRDQRIYLAELDVHFPELTLGQTLSFAVSCRQRVSVEQEAKKFAETFRLAQAFGTRVGSDMIRGVSGGEKRRTSIAEAFISGAQVQCWDNSTRGLDSFTALSFVKVLRDSTNLRQSTVSMSLYQASERMYNMFDKVTLLYEGRQIYFGPVDLAVGYFTSLGFIMPRGATAADFLTSLTNPAERIVNPDHQGIIPRLPDEFANIWKHSPEARALRDAIAQERATFGEGRKLSYGETPHSIYSMSSARQVALCMGRAVQRIQNEIGPTLGAIIANMVLGLVVGSAFYNLPNTTDSFQQRAVVIFFSLIVNSFSPAYEITMMWTSRPIVEKQQRYAFYRPSMDGFASIMSEFPNKLASSFSLHLPIYFLANLKLDASGFFIHWLFMLANMLTMSMLFRVIGSLSRALDESTPPVSVMSLLCVIYSGFVVPPDYMRPWLGWFWRINPVAYTYEALMINEFRDRQFPCSTTIPTGPTYAEVSGNDRICAVIGSESGQDYVDGSRYLFLKYGYTTNHLWRNLGVLFAIMIPLFFIYLFTVEYIPARPSRGEVLFFKRRRSHRQQPVPDDETGNTEVLTLYQGSDEPRLENTAKAESNAIQDRGSLHGATFQWESLGYTIKTADGTKTILSNISGWVSPGTLTALMGITGAGKTALLDTLAGRITTGVITGDVYVNGHKRDVSFKRRMGYVQQSDIHLHTATVREALQFSALLRQPKSVPRTQKLAYVEEVLDIMEMKSYADAIVGVPGEGLNVEQRKRLTIAVEMAFKPDLLLFLDEPTSGLDSQTAWSICTLLRKLAESGQTILCTIHQPSSQLFFMFDRLLLMGKGGTTLYFGEIGQGASTVIGYFEEQGAQPCKVHENPAEWILEVTGNAIETSGAEAVPSANEEWSQKWKRSLAKENVIEELKKLRTSRSDEPVACSSEYQDAYAATSLQQLFVVSNRIFIEQWRDPSYTLSKIALCISISLINGISFYKIDFDIQGLTSVIFSTFLLTQLFSCINQLIIPRFVKGRQLFEARERHSNSYTWSVFVASNIVTELAWQTAISAVVFVCWYYPLGLHKQNDSPYPVHERGALNFILIWLFNLWANTMSQAFGAGIEDGELVAQIATLCFWLSLVFSGILVPRDSLRSFWIWMYRVSPLTYLIEGLTVAGLGNATLSCSNIEILDLRMPQDSPATTSCKQYLENYISTSGGYLINPEDNTTCQYCPVANADVVLGIFGMERGVAWRDVGIMAAYVAFNILATFSIYWLVRVPKDLKRKS